MPTLEYTAKRSLVTGHVLDIRYEMEVCIRSADDSTQALSSFERSPGGGMEVSLERLDKVWSITFLIRNGTQLLALREMLDSTESGETFRLWLYGDPRDSESVPLYLKRSDEGHTEMVLARRGGEGLDLFQSSIVAVEVVAFDPVTLQPIRGGYSESADPYSPEGGGAGGGMDGGDGGGIIVRVYDADDIWSKPDGLMKADFYAVGGGRGGQGGVRGTAGSGVYGRLGSGASVAWVLDVNPLDLPSSLNIEVGAGGAGTAGSPTLTPPALGASGEASAVRNDSNTIYLQSAGASSFPGIPQFDDTNARGSGAGENSGGASGPADDPPGGGGTGQEGSASLGGGGAGGPGGVYANGSGGNGSAGGNAPAPNELSPVLRCGGGGGGAGSSWLGSGGNGGAGGMPGGGGGGGGCVASEDGDTGTPGSGGNGANGRVVVVEYY